LGWDGEVLSEVLELADAGFVSLFNLILLLWLWLLWLWLSFTFFFLLLFLLSWWRHRFHWNFLLFNPLLDKFSRLQMCDVVDVVLHLHAE